MTVGTDTTGHHEAIETGLLQGATTLDGQGIDNGIFKGSGDISTSLLVIPIGSNGVGGKGLETGETHVESGAIGHGTREMEAPLGPLLSKTGEQRAARIIQPHQLGGLVKRLACRIVYGFTEQLVAADAIDPHQHGVAAGDQQRNEGKLGRTLFQHGGQQMSFHMMHGDGRLVPRHGQRTANGGPDQNGADQTRARCVGDAVDVILTQSRLLQCGLDQRDRLANMIPAGQLGDDATVVRMQLDLAV